jgi:hypothetical protein
MQSTKRLLDSADCSYAAAKKRSGGTRGVALPLFLRELAHDAACFLSVVPNDILTALAPFLPRRGRVKDPYTLRFESERLLDLATKVGLVHFDRHDNLLLTLTETDAVRAYDAAGLCVRTVGSPGDHCAPTACVEDSRGRVFVSETRGGSINVFSADGALEYNIPRHWRAPRGLDLSLDESTLYAADYYDDKLVSFCADNGAYICAWSVLDPIGVAVLANGHVAVSSYSPRGKISVFATDGTLVRTFGSGLLIYPYQIAADADDNLYVANDAASGVVVFSAGRHFIRCVGGRGTGCTHFPRPWGIAIDSAGTVAVTDSDGKRVQFFKSA